MKQHLRTKLTHVIETYNEGILENTEIKKHTYMAGSKEEFMLLYTHVLPVFIGISAPAKNVYAYILMAYKSGVDFEIAGGSRTLIGKHIGINPGTVSHCLSELTEANLLYSRIRGIYRINPRYAFKGSSKDRDGELKAIIELGCKDC